jgi:hypothetical protein
LKLDVLLCGEPYPDNDNIINDSSGHFFAAERPELPARDLKTMFGKGGERLGLLLGRMGMMVAGLSCDFGRCFGVELALRKIITGTG